MQVENSKAALRRELLSARAANAPSDSTGFWRGFIKTGIYADCETLLTYVSVKNEPDTRGLIEYALSDGKRVFVPKTYGGGEMTFYRVRALSELAEGHFGIPEPRIDSKTGEIFDGGGVCVIPALCYNSALHRIGYGGGYYDRFLSGAGKRTTKVLFCGVFREFTADVFDVPADVVISG